MRLRTFIAVATSPNVRKGAQRLMNLLRPVAGDVKWVAPENLHWTLQFLGDVDQDDIPEVCAGVERAVADFEPFSVAAYGASAFPTNDRPRTLWIGASDGANEMISLQGAIQDELGRLGFRGESRRYVPHITLGRAGRHALPQSLAEMLTSLVDHDAGTMVVDEVGIFSSALGREGPTYEALGYARLGE